jgi:hypothetical protein
MPQTTEGCAGFWRRRKCVVTVAVLMKGDMTNAECDAFMHVPCRLSHPNVMPTFGRHVGPLESPQPPGASQGCKVSRCLTLIQKFANGASLESALAAGAFSPPLMKKRWGPIMHLLKGVVAGMAYLHKSRICLACLSPSQIFLQVCADSLRAGIHSATPPIAT